MDYMNLQNLLEGPRGATGLPTTMNPWQAARVRQQNLGAYQQMLGNQQQMSDLSLQEKLNQMQEYQSNSQLRDLTRKYNEMQMQGNIDTNDLRLEELREKYQRQGLENKQTRLNISKERQSQYQEAMLNLSQYADDPASWGRIVAELQQSGINMEGITGNFESDAPIRQSVKAMVMNDPKFKQRLKEMEVSHGYSLELEKLKAQGRSDLKSIQATPKPNQKMELAEAYAELDAALKDPNVRIANPATRREMEAKRDALASLLRTAGYVESTQAAAATAKAGIPMQTIESLSRGVTGGIQPPSAQQPKRNVIKLD